MKTCFAVSIFHLSDHGGLPARMETQWNFVSFREAMGQLRWSKRRERRGVSVLSWVIAARLEEGAGVISPQQPMGACLALSSYPSRKALGDKSGGASCPWPLSLGLCLLHSRLSFCQMGLPLASKKAAGMHQRRLAGCPEWLAWIPSASGSW